MTPERWADVDRIWHAVLARPEAERATAVTELCAGDKELQAEVESLLENLARANVVGFGAIPGVAPGSTSLVGRRLGSYTVRGLLGVGGMGEVYQARDSFLGRDVALKILPDLWRSDPDRSARFDREARVLASLNHPNIGAIYGVHDGDGIKALVLELVEGETLADRLVRASQGLPINEVRSIAEQITEALDAAHERGIIHRDLKPANIKITPEGRVKVLDFGLARAISNERGSTGLLSSPTITVPTQGGVLLGTAAYMSPEQARGRTVDKRSDIWAFGCVLYEMLTGASAFGGDSVADTLGAVLHKEPDWSKLPAATPASMRRLLTRSLQKDPARRMRDIGDAAHEIRERTTDESEAIDQRTPRPRMSPFAPLLAALAVAVAAAVTWMAWPSSTITVTKLIVGWRPGEAPTLDSGFALTPDGSRLAYVGNDGRLWIRDLDDLQPHGLPGTDEGRFPFFSPDGASVAFVARGALKVVSAKGGSVRTLVAGSPYVLGGGDWAQNGMLYFGRNAAGLWRVASTGGIAEVVSRPKAVGVTYEWVDVLPNGKGALLTISNESVNTSEIGVLDLASGEVRSVVAGTQARFASSGHVLYVTAGGTLYSMPFDQNRLSPIGPGVPLIESVAVDVYNNVQAFAISDNGTLLHRPQSQSASELVWVTRSGAATPLVGEGWTGSFFSLSLSPDGRQVAATLTTGTRQDIWTRSLETGAVKRLTFDNDGSLNYRAKWTADGRALTYISNRSGTPGELWWQAADGRARAERLVADGPLIDEGLMSPDGLWAVYRAGGSDLISRDIKAMRLARGADRTPIALVATRAEEYSPVLSPDGRRLAYVSEESGRPEVYVRPFPDIGAGVWQVSQGGGRVPEWARGELFYQNLRGEMVVVRIRAGSTFEWDPPEVLFDASGYEKNLWHPMYSVAPGGDRFLMVRHEPGSEGHLVLTLNWPLEMKRAPATR